MSTKTKLLQLTTLAGGLALALAWSAAAAEKPNATGASGDDWPCWRGPNGNSISAATGWSPAALAAPGGPKVLWKGNVGAGYSAPSVKGDRLYIMGNTANTDTVSCLNAVTGAEVWKHSYPCSNVDHPGPRAAPCVDGALVYTFSSNGDLFALDAATGAVKWQKKVQELQAKIPQWGFASSPLLDGKLLLVNAGEHGAAFNKETGDAVWSSAGTGAYASPVLFDHGGKRLAAIFSQKALFVVDAADGKVAWSYPWQTSYDVNAADPVITGTRMFITSGYKRGCALLDFSAAEPKLLWENKGKAIAAHFSSCILMDKVLFGVDGNAGGGQLVCLEVETGKVLWQQNTGFGGIIMVDQKIIGVNENGGVYICEASTQGYKELATAKGVIGPTVWTAPVLAHGRLYLRNHTGDLVCLDLRK